MLIPAALLAIALFAGPDHTLNNRLAASGFAFSAPEHLAAVLFGEAVQGISGSASDYPEPHVEHANPPPAPSWTILDRVSWGANLVLAIVGYAGVLIALRLLSKIERQVRSCVMLAQSATEASKAVLLNAQTRSKENRPWLMMNIEPSLEQENTFKIAVLNRGKSPARIVASAGRVAIAAGEKHLPQKPEYRAESLTQLKETIILLPGESSPIQRFGRDDLMRLCKSEDVLHRIEIWQEHIYLYGRIVYEGIPGSTDSQYITDWCCKYVHGDPVCNLVPAGSNEYRHHT